MKVIFPAGNHKYIIKEDMKRAAEVIKVIFPATMNIL